MTDTSQVRSALAERATSQAVEPASKRKTIADVIKAQSAEIARALPKHMDAERLARIALTTIKTTPKLLECTQESLLGALMLSAQTGLEPGPLGHVYFVPRKIKGVQECQWMLGYKGIIELARRSGEILSIEAREVCQRDEFRYSYGLDEELHHRPFMDGDRGPLVAVWGLAKFKDGGHYFVVLSRADVDLAMSRSDSAKSGFGPWKTDYSAMARKTAIRRMAPYLPLSPEQAGAIAQDETVHTSIVPDMVSEPPESGWVDVASWEEPPPEHVDVETGEVPGPTGNDEDVSLTPEPMSQPQSRALHALLKSVHGAQGDDRFPVLTGMLGREVTSTSEISKAEASLLIDQMQAAES